MALINKDTIDKIYSVVNVVDVVSDYVHLKKRGSNYVGLSPFANEKTPSFVVNPAKGIFKCFSSGIGGDTVGFVMEVEKVNYPEALRLLAKKYNIPIEEEVVNDEDRLKQKQDSDLKESLYVANSFAKGYFNDTLFQSEEGKAIGLTYFEERKLSVDTIKKFELGYSPNGKTVFTDHALNNGYSLDILIKAGLTKTNEDRSWKVDTFQGRVIFPIHNLTGRCIGFGGRILTNAKDTAKYINTSETEVYNKSKTLYGLHLAKKQITKDDNVFLTEGYMDVIAMFEMGLENTVASSGTSLTEEQVRQLKKFTNNITILYDGDNAGIKAAFRAIDMILSEGLNVKLILFPDNDDPDSYSKKVGRQAFLQFVASNTLNFIQYKKRITEADIANDPLKKTVIVKELVQTLALVTDTIARSVYVREVAKQFEVDEQILINELNKQLRKKIGTKENSPDNSLTEPTITADVIINEIEAPKSKDIETQEFDIVRLMMVHGVKTLFFQIENSEGKTEPVEISLTELTMQVLHSENIQFSNPLYQKILTNIDAYFESGFVPDENYFLQHQDKEISSLAIDFATQPYKLSDRWLDKFEIMVIKEEDQLKEALQKIFLLYKFKRLDELYHSNLVNIKTAPTVEEEQDYLLLQQQIDTFKKQFSIYLKPIHK